MHIIIKIMNIKMFVMSISVEEMVFKLFIDAKIYKLQSMYSSQSRLPVALAEN